MDSVQTPLQGYCFLFGQPVLTIYDIDDISGYLLYIVTA